MKNIHLQEGMSEVSLEHLSSREVNEQQRQTFNALAPTEMHALTFILMSTEGALSRTDARKMFMAAQGENHEWEVSSNLNFSYSTDRFQPAGLTDVFYEERDLWNRKGPVNVLVTEVRSPQETIEHATATCGVLLDWSLGTQFSLRDLFGESRKSEHDGGTLMRRNILETIIDRPGISEMEITRALGLPDEQSRSLVNAHIKQLEHNGVLVTERASEWDGRLLKISGEGFKHVALRRKDLTRETRAIYDAVDILAVTGIEEVSAEDLFNIITSNRPDLDINALGHTLSKALSSQTAYSQGGKLKHTKLIPVAVGEGAFNGGMKTRIQLHPDAEPQVRHLLHTLSELDSGANLTIEYFANRALEIAGTPQLVNLLVKKAKSVSPHKNLISSEQLIHKIEAVVIEEGPMTVSALAKSLTVKGVRMSQKSLSKRISDLAKEGRLVANDLPRNNRSTASFRTIIGVDNSTTSIS